MIGIPVSVNVPSTPKGDTNNKRQHRRSVGEKSSPTCKFAGKQTDRRVVITEEHIDSSVAEETEHISFPKIVEVYSLNSLKMQGGETENRKRKNVQDVSSCQINDEKPRDVTEESHAPLNWKKPYVVSDNFIDLTVDDEEDNKAVSSDKISSTVNMNGNCQSELEHPKEDTSNKGMKRQSTKCSKRKVKGRKGKRRQPTKQYQGNAIEKPIEPGEPGCDKSDSNTNIINNNKNKETLQDHNNNNRNNTMKRTSDEERQSWMCDNLNNGKSNFLDMSYRKNKITDLKARLAKQEEELAKLRTVKECKAVTDMNPHAPVDHSGMENSERNENSRNGIDNQRIEASPGMVNLEDICQHVMKSFDIFNSRTRKDKAVGKEGLNGVLVFNNDTSFTNQANVGGYRLPSSANVQDEFLFQLGLRRKSSSQR